MTITLELTPEEETRLVQKAEEAGITPAAYLLNLINSDKQARRMTGKEAIEYWRRVDALGVFTDEADSPELARELRTGAETRRW